MVVDSESWTQREIERHREEGERKERERAKINNNVVTHTTWTTGETEEPGEA